VFGDKYETAFGIRFLRTWSSVVSFSGLFSQYLRNCSAAEMDQPIPILLYSMRLTSLS